MEIDTPTRQSWAATVERIFNLINHVCIGFVAIYMTYACFRHELSVTAIHAWLCAIGYQLLMAQSILCLYSGNILLSSYSRKTKTTAHWILQVLGCGLAISGAIYKISTKDVHFQSIHSITGLTATILLGFGLLSGLTALFSVELRKVLRPLLNKTFHVFLGMSGFTIGMVSLLYGYSTGFFKRNVDPTFADILKVFTILTILLTLIGPIKSMVQKTRVIFNGD